MDVDKLAIDLLLKGMTQEQQKAALESIKDSVTQAKAIQKQRIGENVQVVIQALKKIESDIKDKYDGVTTVIEKRVASIKDGKDGRNGADGKAGKDGRPGRDGAVGPRGVDGLNGRDGKDGENGVSVTDAYIDFDGSLIIRLSSGQTLNVGEVVAPDLAEKIKVITNGGGTSQSVLDTLTSLQDQINALVSMGSVNYVGTWNASTNTPIIVASTGDKGDYYVVSVAGSTSIDGQSLWGVGDWIIFNGSVWQKVDGGSTGDLTTLTVTGNTTLGDATTDTVTVNGYMGVGISPSANVGVFTRPSGLTTTTQIGVLGGVLANSAATTLIAGVYGEGRTAASAFTVSDLVALYANNTTKGAGSTITSQHGLYITDQTQGTNNYGITSLVSSGTNKWNIYASGTADNYFAGDVGIGTSSPTQRLDVSMLNSGASGTVAVFRNAGTSTVNTAARIVLTSRSGDEIRGSYIEAINVGGANYPFDLVFGTSSSNATPSEKMRIDSSGNVGIGTSSPDYKLQVSGTALITGAATFSSSVTANSLIIKNSGVPAGQFYRDADVTIVGSAGQGIEFGARSGATYIAGAAIYGGLETGATTGNLVFQTLTSGSLTTKLTITNAGNVGFGTSTPNAYPNYTTLTIDGLNGSEIDFDANGVLVADMFSSSAQFNIRTVTSIPLIFSTAASERARFTSSGNLLIGTTTDAGQKLQVNGNSLITGTLSVTGASAGNSISVSQGVSIGDGYGLNAGNFQLGAITGNRFYIYNNTLGIDNIVIDPSTGVTKFNKRINIQGLPTSPVGLVAGDVWNNLGVLNIV